MLKWARANGCPWDYWTCSGAAEGGHLELLEWAAGQGCDWNPGIFTMARCIFPAPTPVQL